MQPQSMSTRKYKIHTVGTAPEKCKAALQGVEQKFGFLPNIIGTMAESPVLVNGFVGVFGNFHGGSLTAGEKQVLLLTNAVTLRCPLTVAIHSTLGLHDGVPASEIAAIRSGHMPRDPKFAALSALTKALIEKRGDVTEVDLERFLSAGYSSVQMLEVIAGVGVSTLAAFTAHAAAVPMDERFKAQAWAAA